MVKVKIIMEGGSLDTADVQTVDNTIALREALHRIFTELTGKETSVEIVMQSGYRQAALSFIQSQDPDLLLCVDLDDREDKIGDWFTKLETENPDRAILFTNEQKEQVFFMIQEMEAWILYQPQILDVWGEKNQYVRQTPERKIEEDEWVMGKIVTEIDKPSYALSVLIGRFFKSNRKGKLRNVKYGKLKSAPGLLDCIDIPSLLGNDQQLQLLEKKLNK